MYAPFVIHAPTRTVTHGRFMCHGFENKARDCEFGDLHNSLVRNIIVSGINDDQVRGSLLREPDLTL